MLALGFLGVLSILAICAIALVLLVSSSGLFAKPVAPKVPEKVVAGTTIRIEDGGSSKIMLALHPTSYHVYRRIGGSWSKVAESKETKKHRFDYTVPVGFRGSTLKFTARNECPVSKWRTKESPPTEREVV